MSSTNAGRQSPTLESQSGAQGGDPNASAQGERVSDGSDNQKTSQDQLKELKSNPVGVLDQHAKDAASKTVGDKAK